MKYYLQHLYIEQDLGLGTAIIVKAENEEEAKKKIENIIETIYNLDYELHDEEVQEVNEKDLKVIEKYMLADVCDVHDYYKLK